MKDFRRGKRYQVWRSAACRLIGGTLDPTEKAHNQKHHRLFDRGGRSGGVLKGNDSGGIVTVLRVTTDLKDQVRGLDQSSCLERVTRAAGERQKLNNPENA